MTLTVLYIKWLNIKLINLLRVLNNKNREHNRENKIKVGVTHFTI